jgi:hypothetical protein
MAAERRRAAALDRRHHLQDSACRGRVYLDQKEQDHEQLDD